MSVDLRNVFFESTLFHKMLNKGELPFMFCGFFPVAFMGSLLQLNV